MIMIYQFDAATQKAIKNGDIAHLLKQLNSKPICDFAYNLSHYFNGACNFGANETLKELLKLQQKGYSFGRARGIIEHYWGGRPYSVLMHLSIKNHHNDCLQTLFDHIQPEMPWGESTALVSQCIEQALNAKNPRAIKIAMDFEKSCRPTRPNYYNTCNDIDLWWPRLQNKNKTQAKQVIKYMDKSLVDQVLVWRLHARSEHTEILRALIDRCNPKKVTTLISKTNLPPIYKTTPQDIKWLDNEFIGHQKAVLNKAVRGAKTAPRVQRKI